MLIFNYLNRLANNYKKLNSDILRDDRNINMETIDLIKQYRKATDDFNKNMIELASLKKKKAIDIINFRSEKWCKSYADAERQWEITDNGQKEIELIYYSKGLEKIISGINAELRQRRQEYWDTNV